MKALNEEPEFPQTRSFSRILRNTVMHQRKGEKTIQWIEFLARAKKSSILE